MMMEACCIITLYPFKLLNILMMGKVEIIDIVTHFHFQAIADVQGVITFRHVNGTYPLLIRAIKVSVR